MVEAVLVVLRESVLLPLPRRRKVVTKRGKSKLIDAFPRPSTHVLYLMLSTLCDHDSYAPDPTTTMKLRKNEIRYNGNG